MDVSLKVDGRPVRLGVLGRVGLAAAALAASALVVFLVGIALPTLVVATVAVLPLLTALAIVGAIISGIVHRLRRV